MFNVMEKLRLPILAALVFNGLASTNAQPTIDYCAPTSPVVSGAANTQCDRQFCIESGVLKFFSGTGSSSCTTINFMSKSISALGSGVFSGLTNLELIYLYDNQLVSIEGAFVGLTNLKQIFLDYNKINALSNTVFSDQSNSLVSLALYGNEIASVDTTFHGLTKLENLGLDVNKIQDVSTMFQGIASLKVLTFFGNQVTSLPSGWLQGTTVRELTISDNQIGDVPDFSELGSLTWMFAQNNKWTTASAGAFQSIPSTANVFLTNQNGLTCANISPTSGFTCY